MRHAATARTVRTALSILAAPQCLDKDFDADAAWRLPVAHPEGIAFDGKTLYVVSDSERRIYEFELDSD